MNPFRSFWIGLAVTVSAGFLATTQARAAGTPSNAPTAAVSNTIPLSVFDDARTAGKDPFFPNSRRRSIEATAAVTGATTDVSSLALQGISGTVQRPLAVINNRTFTTGEENEVTTASGRMRI